MVSWKESQLVGRLVVAEVGLKVAQMEASKVVMRGSKETAM